MSGMMFPMPRPVWSGTISFGLVAIPMKLYNAVNRKSVSFNQLDERTMSRIRYRKVSDETGEEVPDENIVKGYEVSKGRYVIVDPDELEPFIPAATRSVELEEFVDLERHRPGVLRQLLLRGARRQPQAVRPARPGDGARRARSPSAAS